MIVVLRNSDIIGKLELSAIQMFYRVMNYDTEYDEHDTNQLRKHCTFRPNRSI